MKPKPKKKTIELSTEKKKKKKTPFPLVLPLFPLTQSVLLILETKGGIQFCAGGGMLVCFECFRSFAEALAIWEYDFFWVGGIGWYGLDEWWRICMHSGA